MRSAKDSEPSCRNTLSAALVRLIFQLAGVCPSGKDLEAGERTRRLSCLHRLSCLYFLSYSLRMRLPVHSFVLLCNGSSSILNHSCNYLAFFFWQFLTVVWLLFVFLLSPVCHMAVLKPWKCIMKVCE